MLLVEATGLYPGHIMLIKEGDGEGVRDEKALVEAAKSQFFNK
jgi:hypothetical protein